MNKALSILLLAAQSLWAADTVWEGSVTVSGEVKVTAPDKLVIKSGAVVNFVGEGRLACMGGKVDWEGVEFRASAPMPGASRIVFERVSGSVSDCTFKGMVTENLKFHNAFFSARYSKLRFSGNRFTGCSALELVLCDNAAFEGNLFKGCNLALALFHCRDAVVDNNSFRDCKSESLLLNEAANCLVRRNRVFNPSVGIALRGKEASGNMFVGNMVFSGVYGMAVVGGCSRNLVICGLFDRCRVGLRLWGVGADNSASNCVFWKVGGLAERKDGGEDFTIRNSVLGGALPKEGLALENNLPSGELFKDPDNGDFRPRDGSPLLKSSIGLFPAP